MAVAAAPVGNGRRRWNGRAVWRLVATYLVLLLVAAAILFPIYWMVIISLKLPRDIYRMPSLLPMGADARELSRADRRAGISASTSATA